MPHDHAARTATATDGWLLSGAARRLLAAALLLAALAALVHGSLAR